MFDPAHIIQSGGLLLIGLLIFGESGMLVGLLFPGDTLLIAAGIFAAQGKLSLASILVVASLAAIAGDNVGFHIGKTMGPRLFRKRDSVLFRHEYVERAERFFNRFGSKTMLLSHFVPIVRTFGPIVAGVGGMQRSRFFIFDAIGDVAWAIVTTLIGYWFGSRIPNVDHYILLAVCLAVLATFGPMAWHIFINKRFWKLVGKKLNRK